MAGSAKDKLDYAEAGVIDAWAAVNEKGGVVNTDIALLGDGIRAISGGDVIKPKDVNFYDYDGTLLHAWTLAEAQTATSLPAAPTHDRLIFQEWSWSLADINALMMPMNVGTTYTTASGASEFDITLTVVTGLSVTVRMYNTSGVMSVEWGNGENETSAVIGLNTFTHDYGEIGNYTVSVDSTGVYYPYGNTASPYNMFNVTPSYICTSARLGDRCSSFALYALYNCYNVETIIIPSGTTFGIAPAMNCRRLKNIIFPSGVTTITQQILANCISLQNICIPSSVTSIAQQAFSGCTVLKSVPIPSNITSISSNVFQSCYNVTEYIMHKATPPSLSNTGVFTGINAFCKIRVPKGSLSAYQTATNWATYANYMVEWEAET